MRQVRLAAVHARHSQLHLQEFSAKLAFLRITSPLILVNWLADHVSLPQRTAYVAMTIIHARFVVKDISTGLELVPKIGLLDTNNIILFKSAGFWGFGVLGFWGY